MFEFQKIMEISESVTLGSTALQTWKRINVGEYGFSIQASSSHYSSPRETIPDATAYSEFELAIFRNDEWAVSIGYTDPDPDNEFAGLERTAIVNVEAAIVAGCPTLEAWLSDPYDTVVGWVPAEEIQKMIDNAARWTQQPPLVND